MDNLETKDRLYLTAKRLFFYEGYNVGSRRIAAEANANQGLITYYFKSKETLALMVFNESHRFIDEAMSKVLKPEENYLLYNLSYIYILIRYSVSHPVYNRFIVEVMENGIYETYFDSISDQLLHTKQLIEQVSKSAYSTEKCFFILTSAAFGMTRHLIPKLGIDDFTGDELYDLILSAYLDILKLDESNSYRQALGKQIHETVEKVVQLTPKVTDPEQYLIKDCGL